VTTAATAATHKSRYADADRVDDRIGSKPVIAVMSAV
jgi:hypothetical protein